MKILQPANLSIYGIHMLECIAPHHLLIVLVHYNIYLSILQRQADRLSAFNRLSYNDVHVDRRKWRKVLVTEMISSDESESEDGKGVFSVKNLQWRSDKVTRFFSKLDDAQK